MKLYLITGFLGAGKTTFLKNLIAQMRGYRIKVIVNEFGKEGIDGTLLNETGAKIEEINNGSIFCSCRLDQFEQALEKTVSENPDFIFVEASGLSDPGNMDKIISSVRESERIEYMGSVCLVDAVNFKKVLATARVCKNQLKASDIVLLNKTDLVDNRTVIETEELIYRYKPSAKIIRTIFGRLRAEWICGQKKARYISPSPVYHLKDVSLQKKLIVLSDSMKYSQLEKFLQMFVKDTYRVKGFVFLEGRPALIDCVGAEIAIRQYNSSVKSCNRVVALAGQEMPMEKSLKKASECYPQYILSIE